jgi:hypothetical protein
MWKNSAYYKTRSYFSSGSSKPQGENTSLMVRKVKRKKKSKAVPVTGCGGP